MSWIDKLHIVETVGGFQKITGGTAWNGGTRTNTPIAISKEGSISITVTDNTKKFAIGLSKTYRQGNYLLFDFAFVVNTTLSSIAKGTTVSHGSISNGSVLTIRKTKIGNEFYIQFFSGATLLRSYNAGLSWEVYYGELAMQVQGETISAITFTEIALTPPTILTPTKTYTFFQDNIFNRLMPEFIKEEDSYKDVNKRGFLQRFLETFGKYLDEYIAKYVAEITDRTVALRTIEDYLIPYWETQLGVNLKPADSLAIRRKVLENFITLSKVKGSKRGYTLAMKLLLFDNFLIENVNVIPDYANPIPAAGCNACITYDLEIQATLLIISAEIVDAIFKVAGYNEPINWKLDETVYNDYLLTKDFVTFYFDENPLTPALNYTRKPNLYIDDSRNTTLLAEFDSQGNLDITDTNENYYEFDSTYFGNQGRVIFRKESASAYSYFNASTPTTITKSSFIANWTTKAGATKYFLNVGTEIRNDNAIIQNRVIDMLELSNATLSQVVIDLEENTTYYYQVIALSNTNKKALSTIKPLLTLQTVNAPTAVTPIMQGSNYFVASWNKLAGATAYELDVATDSGFTSLIVNNRQLNDISRSLVSLSTGTYYYRVRACIDRKERWYKKPKSVSSNSNTITVTI